jgi:NAD(P)-dependent dehydrogenase (short-subunit alcohol dehydrogenase family)
MKNKIVVVTGAFGFMGSAVVEALQRSGASVVALDYASHAPEALATVYGECEYVQGSVDIADFEAATRVAHDVVERVGAPDALVNIAGGFSWETLAQGSFETWGCLFRMNVETAVSASKAFLPFIRQSEAGRIINIGAAAAVKAGAGMGPYAASKSGVMRFTESLAEEVKGDSTITVNALLPSILDTPANRSSMPDADFSQWVKPDDIAAAVLFLLSPQASAITGALIPVTGRV